MAQTLLVAPSVMPCNIPPSPDPTPLRLLAFSVAEAALQSNPNSPSIGLTQPTARLPTDWSGPWCQPKVDLRPPFVPQRAVTPGGSRLWDVVERAKERRVKNEVTPPGDQYAYNFVLPSNSPLATSVAAHQSRRAVPPRDATHTPPPRLNTYPLYTRSAEPSPTFDGSRQRDLDISSPRLSANDFAKSQRVPRVLAPQRADSTPLPSRHISRLPSLAQIQAKLNKAGHRRSGSAGSSPQMPSIERTISNDSMEILQTPRGQTPPIRPHIVNADSPERCPATPPSPTQTKDARLASFLRQRTSGRLAEAMAKPLPVRASKDHAFIPGSGPDGPVFTITPPTMDLQRPSTPVKSIPTLVLSTPPSRSSPLGLSSPVSPTDSLRSASTNSPTVPVPIITCTPAPVRLMRNGVEQDSDEEEGDVVLFEGEIELEVEGEGEDRVERERRSKEMRDRLMLRRPSD